MSLQHRRIPRLQVRPRSFVSQGDTELPEDELRCSRAARALKTRRVAAARTAPVAGDAMIASPGAPSWLLGFQRHLRRTEPFAEESPPAASAFSRHFPYPGEP